MSSAGGWDRRGGGARLGLPRQQPPVAVDVGCDCRGARLLGSLVSALKSFHARGGRKAKPSPHAAWSWSSSGATATTTTAFAPSVSATTATSASSAADLLHSWGPATYPVNASAALYDDDGDGAHDAERARRQRRRRRRRRRSSRRRRGEEREMAPAQAVEVESAAPYEDFRESMVAMVTEKEMYAWEDLNGLLHQFLALNSPRHHPLILTAFADLWAPRGGLFCPPSPCLL
ncbi:transcription repressor OFP8-like [Panicum virgatum]|uniref:Transcription repressor n=1 Tax=Panicum virgatum TaxID=38727 RepID=A0A8T0UWM0_PANVG|nr:transcription repressor OFP8-like [Panicum virgatum]KAG2627210.1 hypothetical protein PVAP13_3KG122135 [Panicum virgatum]